MKTLLILLLLTIICYVSYNSALPIAPQPLHQCCSKSSQTAVLKGRIKDMQLTHSTCKHKAILLTTVCNKTLCIDSNWTWAKKALSQFEKSKANKEAPSAPFNQVPCNTTSG